MNTDKQVIFDLRNFPTAEKLVNSVLAEQFRVIVTGGGVRGGKTFNSLGALILLMKLYPNTRCAIIRENLTVLKRNTLPACEKVIPKKFVKKFNGSDYLWTFTNGSQMFFMSENYDQDKELDAFNGLEINFALLEQMEEIQEKTFQKTLERIGSYVVPSGFKQPMPLLIGTVNPTNKWVRRVIYEPYVENRLPEKWSYQPALLEGNPHIPDSYKESLLQLKIANPQKYLQFVKGSWDIIEKVGGEFYSQFDISKHTAQTKYKYDPNRPLHISFDFNFLPYLTLLVFQVQGNDIFLIEEICMKPPANTPKNILKLFEGKYPEQKAQICVYGDYSGKNRSNHEEDYFAIIFSELKKVFPTVIDNVKPNPSVALRGDFINNIFDGGQDFFVTIDENCTNTTADFINIQKNKDGAKLKEKYQGVEKYGHCSDAFDYFICELYKQEFKVFFNKTSVDPIVVPRPTSDRRF